MVQKKEELKKGIAKNTLYNLIFNLVNRVGGLIFTIIVARLLLPELFGIYSIAIAIVFLLLTSLDAGVNTTSIKYVSESLGNKKEEEARAYFRYFLKLKSFFVGAIALLLLVFAKQISIYIFHKPPLILPLQIGAVYFLITSILTSFVSAFYSLQKVKYNTAQESIFQISRILLVLIFVLLLKYNVEGVVLALAVGALFSLSFLFFFLNKDYSYLFKGRLIKIDKTKAIKFWLVVAIGSISGSFFVHIDSIMLGALIPQPEFVGFYQIALTIAGGIAAIITFANVFIPIFTQQKGRNFKNIFKKVFYYSFSLSLPLAAGLALIAKPFITLLFGQGYEPAILPLYLLSFLIVESATGIFFTIAFQAKGKPHYPTLVMVIASILNIILNYVLITLFAKIRPDYSMIGSAIAIITSRYFYFFALAILAKKHLKVGLDKQLFKPFFATIFMVAFLLLFNYYIGLRFPIVLLELIMAAFIYIAVLFLIKGVSKKDISLLKMIRF